MSDQGDLAARVQQLEDIESIRRLKARYCDCADHRDETGWSTLFTDDAVWDGGRFGRIEGIEEIEEFFHEIPKRVPFSKHYVTNAIIDVDGDEARARWYLIAACTVALGNEAVWGAGVYDEEYRRVDGAWRIHRLRFDPAFWSPVTEGWVAKQFWRERLFEP